MADRIVKNHPTEVPPMPEALQRVLVEALNEGKDKLTEDGLLIPFTMLVAGGNLFIEQHPGNTPTECFNAAKHTVEGARGAIAYAFCYDGYVDTDEGTKDAVIAEGGTPGADEGFALGYLYTPQDDASPKFATNPSYIGNAPNFMERLKESSEYPDVDEDMSGNESPEPTDDEA